MNDTAPLDILLLVPFQPLTAHAIDPAVRQTLGAHYGLPLGRAMAEWEAYLGRPLGFQHWTDHALFQPDDPAIHFSSRRSLTAVTLAACLKKQNLRWHVVDPGDQELVYWRRVLEKHRRAPPRVVGLSTSFVMSGRWLSALCGLVRRILPQSKLVVGGSFYLTSAKDFLGLDADVFCIGEGEHRLPQLVTALRDNQPLDGIPGLYIRKSTGELKHTGPVPTLDLNTLDPIDWQIANDIDPPLDPAATSTYFMLETQRGCAFRCEFCTYHTMARHVLLDVDRAVAQIQATAAFPRGHVMLIDSTATFPHARWHAILERLAAAGGAPHPLIAFARVSDLNEPTAALMARAGVHEVFIGQESGDQEMLDAMRKATRVEHVAAAVAALAKHRIGAQFCFIHGFPGETDASLANTRAMIAGLNRGCESDPVALTYVLTPFLSFDFATVTRKQGGGREPFSPQRAAEAVLTTVMATSRVPNAPVGAMLFEGQGHFLFTIGRGPQRLPMFRWLKAMERGLAVFLERELEGKQPDDAELRTLRETALADAGPRAWWRSAATRLAARTRRGAINRLAREWSAEATAGPGRLTRLSMYGGTMRDFNRVRDALRAWREGTYPTLPPALPCPAETLGSLADELIARPFV